MAATVAEHFDRWAPYYDDSSLQRLVFDPVHRAVIDRCAEVIDRPRCVLDIGCGSGRLLRVARARWPGAVLLGVDISMRMLEAARPAGSTGPSDDGHPLLIRAAAEALPLASGSVDLVTATLTYRHWTDQPAGLAQIRRVLAPEGVLGVATICAPPAVRSIRLGWRRDKSTVLAVAMALAGLSIHSIATLPVSGPFPPVTVLIAKPA